MSSELEETDSNPALSSPSSDTATVDPDQPQAEQTSREEKVEKERERLLSRLASGRIDTLTSRVAWVLNYSEPARDSDVTLQLEYWKQFHGEQYAGGGIAPSLLYQLPKLTSLTRARARIQNSFKLFEASEEVRKHRGKLEEEELAHLAAGRTDYPMYTVCIDESGLNDDRIVIGSVWFFLGMQMRDLFTHAQEFRLQRNFKSEFKFNKITPRNLQTYCDFARLVIEHASAVTFRAHSVERAGQTHHDKALEDLMFETLFRGVEAEHGSGRATLPRRIQVWKDRSSTGVGSDRLQLARIRHRLEQASATILQGKLQVEQFDSMESEGNLYIQIADLYTGCVHRTLNMPPDGVHAKDQFTRYFFDLVGQGNGPVLSSQGGMAVHVAL